MALRYLTFLLYKMETKFDSWEVREKHRILMESSEDPAGVPHKEGKTTLN
jgi:hypothetical protein